MSEICSYSGYGVYSTNYTPQLDGLKFLISMTTELQNELKEYFEEVGINNPTIDDFNEWDLDDGYLGWHGIIARAMNEIEEIQSIACISDDNGQVVVMFREGCPWSFTKKENMLSRTDVDEIFNKYYSVVCGKNVSCDYVTVTLY